MGEESNSLIAVKISAMVIMFILIVLFGSIPIRVKAFKSNQVERVFKDIKKKVLAFSAAFSGGLFLSVGLLHLLPEASEQFDKYYEEQGDNEEHFPFASLISVLSFSLILWIEKIATDAHKHSVEDEDAHQHDQQENKASPIGVSEQNQYLKDPTQIHICQNINNAQSLPDDKPETEEQFKQAVSTKIRIAKKTSFAQNTRKSILENPKASKIEKKMNALAPYVLQVAVGIHAVFEGLAIGIETNLAACLGIMAAVVCHKWAEGLTLGLAFRQAGVDTKTSTIMIIIQAVMNPIGVGLGWILSNQGFLITGIFESISTGTFVYIATIEVIVEEFNIARYKWQKFLIFLLAIGFVSTIWFMEQHVGAG